MHCKYYADEGVRSVNCCDILYSLGLGLVCSSFLDSAGTFGVKLHQDSSRQEILIIVFIQHIYVVSCVHSLNTG